MYSPVFNISFLFCRSPTQCMTFYVSPSAFLFVNVIFQVDSLKNVCEGALKPRVCNENVLELITIADRFNASRLQVRGLNMHEYLPYCCILGDISFCLLEALQLLCFICVSVMSLNHPVCGYVRSRHGVGLIAMCNHK